MPTKLWTHLCDYATIDQAGKPTIVGEFDYINVTTGLPLIWPLFAVITKWQGVNGESFTYQVRVISPSGKELLSSPLENVRIGSNSAKGHGTHYCLGMFGGAQFSEYGEHLIEILVNGTPVDVIPLTVVQKNQLPLAA